MPRVLAITMMALTLSGAATAQQLADDRTRREALAYYRTGSDYLTREQYEKAAQEFQKAIDADPLLALAHYGLGQAHMNLRRYASAILAFSGCRAAYRQLAALEQSNSVAVDRQRDEEIRELRQSIRQIRNGQIKVFNPANHILKLESRVRDLERMKHRRLDPLQPPAEVSLALGSAYFRNGNLEDAEREWKAAVAANSSLGEAHNNLAVVYMMSGRKRAAEEAVKAAEKAGFSVNPRLKEDIRRMETS